jgi:hypothetical protein
VSSHPFMVNFRQAVRAVIFASLLSMLSAASVSLAYGQFTLTASALHPQAGVDPGGSATASIDLGPPTGFNNAVSFSCVVTSDQVTTQLPQCLVSPDSAIPPATPSLTVSTMNTTASGTYQIAVTGTSGSVAQTVTLFLNVTNLTQDYLLSVSPTTAIPSPIPAGSSATTTVSVQPLGSYTGTVTLSCLSITPIVTAAPFCSFNPPAVTVGGGLPPTSTLTVSTFGSSSNITKISNPRVFYAFWLAVPGLALAGAGGRGTHKKKLMGLLFLISLAGSVLLIPACNTTTIGTKALNGQITPNNSYVLTLTAADSNGAAPSNVTTDAATVTVAVTTSNAAH